MGLLGRLTGWDQQKDAHNAVVASHFVETASLETKRQVVQRIIEIQRQVQGRCSGSLDDILTDLDSQPRSVQMNFVALACNSLGIQPNVRGLYFNDVQNPYLAKGDSTTERIDGVVTFINARFAVRMSWPGDGCRVKFSDWLASGLSSGRAAYDRAVHTHLKEEVMLNPQDPRLSAFSEVIDNGWTSKSEPLDVALQVGIAFYVAQCVGGPRDRAEARELYLTLPTAVRLASLGGQVSFERADEFIQIISRYTKVAMMKDLEENDTDPERSESSPNPRAEPVRHWNITRPSS